MLKADLHVHTEFSFDCTTPLEKLIQRCLKQNIGCLAVTDHNTIQGAVKVKEMAPFKVIVGEEIKTREGDLIGLFLQEEVPPGLSVVETAKLVKEQGGLVSLPHPFDRFRGSAMSEKGMAELLPLTDVIEAFNARNTLPSADRKAGELASTHGVALCAVSDAHSLGEIGKAYSLVPDFNYGPRDFLEALRQGNLIKRRSNPLVHLISTYAKHKKRMLRR